MQSWKGSATSGPDDTTIAVYFSGWNNADTALSKWEMPADTMKTLRGEGEKKRKVWFSIGGGKKSGILNQKNVLAFLPKIKALKKFGFDGIMWDIEKVQGSSDIMNNVFRAAFKRVKKEGLEQGITVSHTAPYDTDSPEDGTAFLKAFLQDANIDMISPQLYSEGDEQIPEFDATGNCAAVGCGWKAYENMRSGMKLVPSIVQPSHWQAESHTRTCRTRSHRILRLDAIGSPNGRHDYCLVSLELSYASPWHM